jgi:hypothetical protein
MDQGKIEGLEGFYDPLWNLGQIIGWAETRSPYVVDALSDSTPLMASRDHSIPPGLAHELSVDFAKVAALVHAVPYYESPLSGRTEEVLFTVLRAFQSGALVASGRRNGSGDNEEISKLTWGGVLIREGLDGQICVTPRSARFSAWSNIRVDREQVLASFPAPPQQPRISTKEIDAAYKKRVQDFLARNEQASRDEDEVWCVQMGFGREAARDLRKNLAPPEWQKPGRPKKKAPNK